MSALDVVKQLGSNRTVQRGLLHLQKHSPTILITAGVAATVASTVMIARASMSVAPLIEAHKADIAHLKELRAADAPSVYVENYTEKQFNKDMTAIHLNTGKALFRKYALPCAIGVAGIGMIIGSHSIMHTRNVGLAVALKGAESAFSEYRKRVIEEFGSDKDRDYRLGIYEEVEVDEDGKKKKVTKIGDLHASEYFRVFDKENRNWDPTPGYSLLFLRAQEKYANDLLWSRGHVFLNDVLDALGFERVPEGQQLGWIYKKGAPSEDNNIDFGIFDVENEQKRNFVNGHEQNILLTFNLHGVIWELI